MLDRLLGVVDARSPSLALIYRLVGGIFGHYLTVCRHAIMRNSVVAEESWQLGLCVCAGGSEGLVEAQGARSVALERKRGPRGRLNFVPALKSLPRFTPHRGWGSRTTVRWYVLPCQITTRLASCCT
jgi:hypothetical protein